VSTALVISAALAVLDTQVRDGPPPPLSWPERMLLVLAGAAAFVARVWL
jgi:hypothetical protein